MSQIIKVSTVHILWIIKNILYLAAISKIGGLWLCSCIAVLLTISVPTSIQTEALHFWHIWELFGFVQAEASFPVHEVILGFNTFISIFTRMRVFYTFFFSIILYQHQHQQWNILVNKILATLWLDTIRPGCGYSVMRKCTKMYENYIKFFSFLRFLM
jgi:putative Ca2+/H+ antiporter (TMEM165/GDT1 family)